MRSADLDPLPTPLVPVCLDGSLVIWCKLDYLLSSGSTKDRVARAVLDGAEGRGQLRPGDTVIEASSGSTGIALAAACARRGYRFVAVLPEGIIHPSEAARGPACSRLRPAFFSFPMLDVA